MRVLLLSVTVGALVFAGLVPVAKAQDGFDETERASRELAFEHRQPFGGLTQFAYLSRSWSVNTFYTVFRGRPPEQTKFWIVRRVTGGAGQANTIVWADSRTCEGVEKAFIAMEQLPVVRPDAPQLGQETETMGLVLDGTQHIFWNRWARSGPDDATVGLEISGNVNSPVAEWWAEAAGSLSQCWRATPPE